jgi:hypothetical protein
VSLSRVTWLVLGTALVLVSSVLVAAVLFIDGGGEPFPRPTGAGGSGVARVGSAGAPAAGAGRGGAGVLVATQAPGRRVAARPQSAGLAASLASAGAGSRGGRPSGPTGDQYGDSLQRLNARLWGHRSP